MRGRRPELGQTALNTTAMQVELDRPRNLMNSATDIAMQIMNGHDVTAIAPIRNALGAYAAQQNSIMNRAPTGVAALAERGIGAGAAARMDQQRRLRASEMAGNVAAQVAANAQQTFLPYALNATNTYNNAVQTRGNIQGTAANVTAQAEQMRGPSLLGQILGGVLPAALSFIPGVGPALGAVAGGMLGNKGGGAGSVMGLKSAAMPDKGGDLKGYVDSPMPQFTNPNRFKAPQTNRYLPGNMA